MGEGWGRGRGGGGVVGGDHNTLLVLLQVVFRSDDYMQSII